MPDHPRIRGEHLAATSAASGWPGSSPHTRGALHLMGLDGENYGIIPAYAGSTSGHVAFAEEGTDHPRIRGEHPTRGSCRGRRRGPSPHTRGALSPCRTRRAGTRIIPAYAGSTDRGSNRPPRYRDHPRIRGEHSGVMNITRLSGGSSPHTRGALESVSGHVDVAGIIPAYAGSTVICRDDQASSKGSSPHTRGAPDSDGVVRTDLGIIPAYAGSTTSAPRYARPQADHPRIRGEH